MTALAPGMDGMHNGRVEAKARHDEKVPFIELRTVKLLPLPLRNDSGDGCSTAGNPQPPGDEVFRSQGKGADWNMRMAVDYIDQRSISAGSDNRSQFPITNEAVCTLYCDIEFFPATEQSGSNSPIP